MKKLALAAVITVAASSAYAGGLSAPIMDPTPIAVDTSGSSAGGIVVPLILLALIAAVAAN